MLSCVLLCWDSHGRSMLLIPTQFKYLWAVEQEPLRHKICWQGQYLGFFACFFSFVESQVLKKCACSSSKSTLWIIQVLSLAGYRKVSDLSRQTGTQKSQNLSFMVKLTCIFGNRCFHKTDKAETGVWARTTTMQDGIQNVCVGPALYIVEYSQSCRWKCRKYAQRMKSIKVRKMSHVTFVQHLGFLTFQRCPQSSWILVKSLMFQVTEYCLSIYHLKILLTEVTCSQRCTPAIFSDIHHQCS